MPTAVPLKCPYCGNTDNSPGRELEFGLEFKCTVCDTTSVLVINTGGKKGTQVDKDSGLTTVQSPRHRYTVQELLNRGDKSNLYRVTYEQTGQQREAIFKVARDPLDNDLLYNEARTLQRLNAGDNGKFTPYYPALLESFQYQDGESDVLRQANILTFDREIPALHELYSLKEVRSHYQEGVHSKDMAWMWRRLLVMLGFANTNQIVHGAVLPTHILIHPALHAVILIDWCYAVYDPSQTGNHIKALSAAYDKWYPKEVFDKKPPTSGLDIRMAAQSMLEVMGGDGAEGKLPRGLRRLLRRYFRDCLRDYREAQDPWKRLEEFDKIIDRLWGERKFREFSMPPREQSS